MNVPPILVGHRQGHVIAVQDLNLAHIGTIRREGGRQRQEVGVGFPEEGPGGEDCHQKDYSYLYSVLVDFYIHVDLVYCVI